MAKSIGNRNHPSRSHSEDRPVKLPDLVVNPLADAVDAAIIRAVGSSPGFPTVNVLGAVLKELGPSDAVGSAFIEDRIDALCEVGDITRLHACSGNDLESEFTYYPKDWKFKTTPQTQFLGQHKPPRKLNGMVAPEVQKAIDGFSMLMDLVGDTARLRIMSQFCDRCGARREGHYCNE